MISIRPVVLPIPGLQALTDEAGVATFKIRSPVGGSDRATER